MGGKEADTRLILNKNSRQVQWINKRVGTQRNYKTKIKKSKYFTTQKCWETSGMEEKLQEIFKTMN